MIHPRFRRLPPPVIVIGMHRSGTSPVAAMLETLGVYMGPSLTVAPPTLHGPDGGRVINGYAEAEDFRQANEDLLARAGASWNQIGPFLECRNQPGFARGSLAALQLGTFGRLRSGYLASLPARYKGPWGWKDPRSSLTLPFWLKLFPEARILHVRRDPEAVVESLHRRARSWVTAPNPPLPLPRRMTLWARHPVTTLKRAGRRFRWLPPAPRDPCLDRGGCRDLCRQYVRECLSFREGGRSYLEISYEALLASPLTLATQLAAFAGCAPSQERLLAAAAVVKPQTTPAPTLALPSEIERRGSRSFPGSRSRCRGASRVRNT